MRINQNEVLITGGSSGIGLALARHFLEKENKVIIIGRSMDKLLSVKKQYPRIHIEKADITVEEDIKVLVHKYPDVNILINNAGIHMECDFKNSSLDTQSIKQEISTDFIAPVLLSKYFIPSLLLKKEAAIINISSYFGISPKQSAPIYSASKAALRSFSKALRVQLEGTSVKVFDIAPPIVDTEMTANSNNGRVRKMKPDELVEIICAGLAKDQYEVYPGLAKLFYLLNRWNPRFLEKKLKQISARS